MAPLLTLLALKVPCELPSHMEQCPSYTVQAPTCADARRWVTLTTRDGWLPCSATPFIELNCSLKEEMGRGRGSQRVDIFVTGTKSSDITLG